MNHPLSLQQVTVLTGMPLANCVRHALGGGILSVKLRARFQLLLTLSVQFCDGRLPRQHIIHIFYILFILAPATGFVNRRPHDLSMLNIFLSDNLTEEIIVLK